jgi:hypothetical protein
LLSAGIQRLGGPEILQGTAAACVGESSIAVDPHQLQAERIEFRGW